MATLSQLVARTASRISMVAGTGVQTYAEDVLGEMIQHKFDVLFAERFWPQFCSWNTWTLDETLGIITTDITDLVKDIDDIQIIYPENSNTPLTLLSASTVNPFELAGTTPISYEQLGPLDDNVTSRVFQIWPKAATGNIISRVRTKPDTFAPEDTINFDDQALILGAAFDYCEDDGTNPAQTQKFQLLFESRVKQLKRKADKAPISLDPVTTIPQSFTFTAL